MVVKVGWAFVGPELKVTTEAYRRLPGIEGLTVLLSYSREGPDKELSTGTKELVCL